MTFVTFGWNANLSSECVCAFLHNSIILFFLWRFILLLTNQPVYLS